MRWKESRNAELENEIQNEEFRMKNCSYLALFHACPLLRHCACSHLLQCCRFSHRIPEGMLLKGEGLGYFLSRYVKASTSSIKQIVRRAANPKAPLCKGSCPGGAEGLFMKDISGTNCSCAQRKCAGGTFLAKAWSRLRLRGARRVAQSV